MSKFLSILVISLIAVLQCNCELKDTGFVSKGVIRDLCYNLQKYEVLFNNKCHLQADSIEPQFDWFYEFIRGYDRDSSVHTLLTETFKDSTQYFQTQYPQFKSDYQRFEKSFLELYDKIKRKMSAVTVQDLIDTAKIMTNAYNNITANPKKTCVTDDTICPVLEAMFDIVPVTPFNVTLPKFFNSIRPNIIYFMKIRQYNEFKYEDSLMLNFIDLLDGGGTQGTTVKKLRQFALTDLYKYLQKLSEYTPEVTKKPVVTNAVVKKSTKIAVTSAVTVSIPLALLATGFIVCVLIVVFVYRMKPNKGGSPKTKPAEHTEPTTKV